VWNAICNRFSQGDYVRILQFFTYTFMWFLQVCCGYAEISWYW
jgi:hypothetical protein